MKIGLIGLPNTGKTTIFNALTGSNAEVASYSLTQSEPNIAVVDVIDERVDNLSDIYSPKKTVYANLNIVDFVGISNGNNKNEQMSGETVKLMKNVDALSIVLKNYMEGLENDCSPEKDLQNILDELLLSDLLIAEKRLEKIQWTIQRGQKTNELLIEEKIIKNIVQELNNGNSLRNVELDKVNEKIIRGFQFLTLKPVVVILNSHEDKYGENDAILNNIRQQYPAIEFAGKFEMELFQMDDEEEIRMFMEDMGIQDSARNKLTKLSYELLGNISFFTVGDDEVRAWTIWKGCKAPEAAGTIHSDLERGYIRAECFRYDDLMEFDSAKKLRDNGKVRLEGKEYIVQDGDILNIRFNV